MEFEREMPGRLVAYIFLIALAVVTGCSDDGESNTSILSVIPDVDYFHMTVSSPEGGYNIERTYKWRCSSRMAQIMFDSQADTAGVVHLVLRDGAGNVVYEKIFVGGQGSFIREETAEGLSGHWETSVKITNLRGCATLTVAAD